MVKPKPKKIKKSKSVVYQKILKSATKEFSDKGYAGARVDEIARLANINKAMIYYHFGDKKSLYAAVLNSTFGNLAESLEKSISWEKKPEENLRIYIHTVAGEIQKNPQIPPIMLSETATGGKNLPEEVVQSLTIILEIMARIIKQGVEENQFYPASSFIIHFMLISPLVFLKQMGPLIQQHIQMLGPENVISKYPEDIIGEIENLIFRAISKKK